MGTLSEDLNQIKSVEDTLTSNKVAQFAYTQTAYNNNDATGVEVYNVNNEQNIPSSDMAVLKVNETILTKGWRAQASSITRMLMNHFLGRLSYNLNKVNDNMSSLLTTLISHRGTADGFATLDENGRIPYSQLPESAMEYKGNWNAETNTPTLADGTGDKGDFYIVQVAGTQNLGSGDIQFLVNDRVIYGQNNTWERLSAGSVHKVNNISPTDGNVTITGEDIKLSSTEETTIKASIDTAEGRLDTAESNIGTITNLQTADKSSLVSAINELKTASGGGAAVLEGRVDAIESNIGTLSSLDTTNKTNLVSAINELNDTKANSANVRSSTSKYFAGTRTGRYVKLGSIPISGGGVCYVSLDIILFASSKDRDYPVGMIELGMSSGNSANTFNINGFSTIPLSDSTNNQNPRIIVEKTSNNYILYIDSTYTFLKLNVSVCESNGYTRGNFEEVAQLTGTIVYNSVTDNDIVYLESITEAIEQISPRFTYVIDSNQALLNWANNVSGNDYSAVLIRRGTWTSTKWINLTASGTKVVVGEAGSKLVITGDPTYGGLSYIIVPNTLDYWMRDVTVECSTAGFYNCTKLINCTCSRFGSNGFHNCTNLVNCTSTSTASYIVTSIGVGFFNCTNLINCTASVRSNNDGVGFYNCTNLTNCTGTGTGTSSGFGFRGCNRVSGCRKGSTCTNSVFLNSYASFISNNAYACADTPEGGFNDPTN